MLFIERQTGCLYVITESLQQLLLQFHVRRGSCWIRPAASGMSAGGTLKMTEFRAR